MDDYVTGKDILHLKEYLHIISTRKNYRNDGTKTILLCQVISLKYDDNLWNTNHVVRLNNIKDMVTISVIWLSHRLQYFKKIKKNNGKLS